MKSDRLLSILLLLQTRSRMPAGELAERLEVSARTIYRDVEALSAAGVPVYAERGRNGGIALLPGFRTDVPGLTGDEARALFVLATRGTHSELGLDGPMASALRKLMAAVPAAHRPAAELARTRIIVDPDRWTRAPRGRIDLDVLQEALFADARLRLRYRSSGSAEAREYTVDPYALVAKAGVWYLVADRDGEPRLFRVDRMVRAGLVDEPVRRRPGVDAEELWHELRRRVEHRPPDIRVRALVRRERLEMFRRITDLFLLSVLDGEAPDGERGAREDQGGPGEWVPVELGYPARGAARQLLQFGTDVRVVAPPGIRSLLADLAAEAARHHAGPADA
ncbi:WYL domain-containing protein [Nocardiopsis sp. CNT-189]|uniref:helix-turn-helix transcriptional regulator n=1 Tax=Nocardiopsis oceanisediminis TaxID=2816862 RepID=UPI003B2B6A98